MLCNLRNCGTGESRPISEEKERRRRQSSGLEVGMEHGHKVGYSKELDIHLKQKPLEGLERERYVGTEFSFKKLFKAVLDDRTSYNDRIILNQPYPIRQPLIPLWITGNVINEPKELKTLIQFSLNLNNIIQIMTSSGCFIKNTWKEAGTQAGLMTIIVDISTKAQQTFSQRFRQ